MLKFIIGAIVGIFLSTAYFLNATKQTNPSNLVDFHLKPNFVAKEANLVGDLVLVSQEYSDFCTQKDDLKKFKFETADFTWTQTLGFGVKFENDEDFSISHDGEGNYTLSLPHLQQLYPIEKGFSHISFPVPIAMEVRDAFFTSSIEGWKFRQRIQRASSVLEGRKNEGLTLNNAMKYLTLPTSVELRNLMIAARTAADTRTGYMISLILSQDAMLKPGQTPELEEEGSLSIEAGRQAASILEGIVRPIIYAKITGSQKSFLNDLEMKELKSLTVKFKDRDNENSFTEYSSGGSC